MRKNSVLVEIMNFGVSKEIELIKKDDRSSAYQIRSARNALTVYLFNKTIKEFHNIVKKMFEYTIDNQGYWHYDAPYFVSDDCTRNLLIQFENKIWG